MNKYNYPCVLTIAGSDSSGGAGIQADLKAISATGSYAATVITVITAQNTQEVISIEESSTHIIADQITAVFNDLNIKAVKIGMLYSREIIDLVAISLKKYKPNNIVLDPVMVSKTGCELLPFNVANHLNILFPYCTLLTPNIPEAEKILTRTIDSQTTQQASAKDLAKAFKINVLLKGGHLDSKDSSDLLYLYATNEEHWFHGKRINTSNTHGTGCTLSSAIASYLAQGYSTFNAVNAAKKYLEKAIIYGMNLKIGHGNGPVNHFYKLNEYKDDNEQI